MSSVLSFGSSLSRREKIWIFNSSFWKRFMYLKASFKHNFFYYAPIHSALSDIIAIKFETKVITASSSLVKCPRH